MQKERLIIKNFFTLKDVDIELGKYNVFIGEQASGKSLILKHLYFFREMINIHIGWGYSIDEIYLFAIKRYRDIFNVNDMENAYIEYTINEYKISIYNSQVVQFSAQLLELCNEYISLQHNDNIRKGYSDKTLNAEYLHFIPSKIYNLQSDYGVNQFIPAGRVILYSLLSNAFNMFKADRNSLNIDYLVIEFGQNYQQARFKYAGNSYSSHLKQLFQELSKKILKGELVYNFDGDFIQHKDFLTRVVNSSSGQQEFVPIYLILLDMLKNKGNLYIEEPEAHLYPSAQKAITELLVYVTNATNSDGLYITTHSPYILTVLNNLILANDVKDKQTLFDKDLLVPFEEVRAYFIADGGARDLRDVENRLILADNLDKVSEQTALDFDKLLDLKYDE